MNPFEKTQCRISDTQVTVKAYGPIVSKIVFFSLQSSSKLQSDHIFIQVNIMRMCKVPRERETVLILFKFIIILNIHVYYLFDR